MRRWSRYLPRPLRRTLRRLYYWPADVVDVVLGRRDPLTPPKRISPDYVLYGGFREHGEAFLPVLTELAGLEPHHAILDVGCGIGRIAAPLTEYLDERGRYEGVDVVPDSIAWCQKAITRRYPNFRFQLIDVYNPRYNPDGAERGSQVKLPFDDNAFDVALLKSVFTHMLVDDVRGYLREISRVLREGGRCVITYFLLNEESRARMESGQAARRFPYLGEEGIYRLESSEDPVAAVAYEESYIRSLYREHGLQILEPIHYGSWRGRSQAWFAQDIIIAQKELKHAHR